MSYLESIRDNRTTLDEMYRVAWALYVATIGTDGRAQSMRGCADAFWRSAEHVEGLLLRNGFTWDDEIRSHVATTVTPRDVGTGMPRDFRSPLVARCMRVGAAVATGHEADLPRGLAT